MALNLEGNEFTLYEKNVQPAAAVTKRRFVGWDDAQLATLNAAAQGVAIADIDAGKIGVIAALGSVLIETGGSFSKGDLITNDASARAVAGNSSNALGIAEGASTGSGQFVPVMLIGALSAIGGGSGHEAVDVGTLAATGTIQGDAAAIVKPVTYATAADGTKGVVLPAAVAGQSFVIYNTEAANQLKVYPASGDDINDGSADAAVLLAGKTRATFIALDGVTWIMDDYVNLRTAQTIAAVKTFSAIPVFPATGITVGATTITETEIGVLDSVAAGTAAADKAVVLATGKIIDEIDITLLKVGTVDKSALVIGTAVGFKIARGIEAVTGTATVVTGLTTVVAVIATAEADLDGDTLAGVSATIGDQAGTPAAGSVILKAWKVTADGDVTFIAANAAKDINWIAIGT